MIICLNGTSSSGKTETAKELQELLGSDTLYFSIDAILYALPASSLKRMTTGQDIQDLNYRELEACYYDCVRTLGENRAYLIIDNAIVSERSAAVFREAVSGLSTLTVKVNCGLNVLEQREIGRGDRTRGEAQSQFEKVHRFVQYDFEVDSTHTPAKQLAEQIFSHLMSLPKSEDRSRPRHEIFFAPSDPQFAHLFLEWRSDEETKKFNPLMAANLESLQKRLKSAKSDFQDFALAESFFWFIEVNSEKMGNVSIQNINQQMLTAEIGYAVASSARKRGVATQALKKISSEIFTHTPLRKLIAYVHEDNISSIRVLERAGYRREGRLRKHYLIDGKPVNELIYGLLREDIKS